MKGRKQGFKITIKNLDSKLEELRERLQNEKENVRGFSDGGASISDDDKKDLAAQIAGLEELKSMANEKQNLAELEDQNKKDQLQQQKNREKDQEIEISFTQENEKKFKEIVDFCEKNGVDYSVTKLKEGGAEVKIDQKPSTSPVNAQASLVSAKKNELSAY